MFLIQSGFNSRSVPHGGATEEGLAYRILACCGLSARYLLKLGLVGCLSRELACRETVHGYWLVNLPCNELLVVLRTVLHVNEL